VSLQVTTSTASPSARQQATRNWTENLAALGGSQPWLAERLARCVPELEWVFGRDGAVTALDAQGRWLGGCSVPQAASQALLRAFDVHGAAVVCFLTPFHASAVQAALDRLGLDQAVIVVLPESDDLIVQLHCQHLAGEIGRHRLWFAAGETWPQDLDQILREHPGLPLPAQFIRLGDGNEPVAEALIGPAQQIISRHTSQRTARINELHRASSPQPRRAVCVVARSVFRLWDDAGFVLGEMGRKMGWAVIDADDPASASTLALAEAAAGCGAIMTANTTRADMPGIAPDHAVWITWLTAPRIPAAGLAGPHDQLLLADPRWRELASMRGWPAERVHAATWPPARPPKADGSSVAVIADCPALEPPREIVDLSSHRLLWETILQELTADPSMVDDDVFAYLRSRSRCANIPWDALDSAAFIDRLIVPAYARGLALTLARAGVELRLHGRGWEAVEPLAPYAAGPIAGRDGLIEAVRDAAVLVHAWPTRDAHPIDACGRRVVRGGGSREQFLRRVQDAIRGGGVRDQSSGPPLSAELVLSILRGSAVCDTLAA
jgi:hypothetical protein